MRFYQYACSMGHAHDEYRATEDRNKPVKCIHCGLQMVLQIQPVSGIVRSPAVPRRVKIARRAQ
jgi:hypothetical protein